MLLTIFSYFWVVFHQVLGIGVNEDLLFIQIDESGAVLVHKNFYKNVIMIFCPLRLSYWEYAFLHGQAVLLP